MFDSSRLYVERLGLVSVVVLSSESRIIKNRLHIIEEIACFKNEKPYLMVVHWSKNPKSGYSYIVDRSKEISQYEYTRLTKDQ